MWSKKIVKEENRWIITSKAFYAYILFLSMLLCSSCSQQDKAIVVTPIGESEILGIGSEIFSATIFYPESDGSISTVVTKVHVDDRPFFNLWKEYAAVPDDVVLQNYNIIRNGHTSIMEIDLSSNFKDYISNEQEKYRMASLVNTLLYNESILNAKCDSIRLTIDGDPLITNYYDYSEPLTAENFGLPRICF